MTKINRQEIQQRLQRIEELVQTLERGADPSLRAPALELMQGLLALHGAGLERLLEIAFDTGGRALIERLAADELVASLLLLYDLHPVELDARVRQALASVRPQLEAHSGNVELLSIADGIVRLRLQGNCHGCPSSAATLRQLIEQAIYESAPDVRAIEVEGVVTEVKVQAAAPGLVQLQCVPGKN
jgi:Fe-S cluster biogenesis protein NfuA